MNDQPVYEVKSAKTLRKVAMGRNAGIVALVVTVAALFGLDLPPAVVENIEIVAGGVGALVWLIQYGVNWYAGHGPDDFEIVPKE